MQSFDEIKYNESKYLMPTYSRYNVAFARGRNASFTDISGKEYIDFGSGIGVNSLGAADPKWVEAVRRQAGEYQHLSNLYYMPVQIELAKLLCEAAGYDKLFFSNSGAEANEAAIKLVRKYSFDKYGRGRDKIITLTNSFHGRTITTLSATGQQEMHNYFFPFTEGFIYAEPNNIQDVKNKIDNTVCGIIIEGIQGEGGVLPLDKDFVEEAFDICRQRDILTVFDEVQTGIGRTGRLLSAGHYGVKPDVVTVAKGLGGGLPIGATLALGKAAETLTAGLHGSTFGGNPVCCAAAIEVLKRVLSDGFLEKVREKGEYIASRIKKMPLVKQVRGKGLMIGIILDQGIDAKEVARKALDMGLMVLTAKSLLRLLPPLTISYEEIDKGLEILNECLNQFNKGGNQ